MSKGRNEKVLLRARIRMFENGKKFNIEAEESCMECLQKELRTKFSPERKELCIEIMRRHCRATKIDEKFKSWTTTRSKAWLREHPIEGVDSAIFVASEELSFFSATKASNGD